jgi:sporulation protein YlmC with PRC-barrel domain
MHAKKQRIAVMLVAAGLGLGNAGVRAQQEIPPDQARTAAPERDISTPQTSESYNRPDPSGPARTKQAQQIKATQLIGKEVKNDQGEQLGKVEDLIINSSHTVNFAVISSDGASGHGQRRIAVPINNLNCYGDGIITLSATADQFKNTSQTPMGAWAAVANEEWTREIDGYYGQPQEFSMTEPREYSQQARTFERDTVGISFDREPVRAVQGNGARQLMTHREHANLYKEPVFGKEPAENDLSSATDTSDAAMQQRISDTLRLSQTSSTSQPVRITVQNGIVTLNGAVGNDLEKKNIEAKVKQMSGVRRVNNQLTVPAW